ncbi:bifunctional riboflavin kinase/FAD synthetase [Riemerella columbipharyngis]|uniref:Riboflavin biosynthesis protein n=1 Tax=Riemerella columbipharyngis TaxID=1071918 RepID=A0A1G7FE68_9FLAO|nr:bifunctional riboflavin kinase/FAD synthetase [Riemerella columbipharyngis]SDE74208.1 riboflavin kinase / FMN adenylyltransferase [Riemerella columbipharyngis]
MNIIINCSNYKKNVPLAISLGMFDGVHIGHQSIISKLKDIAKSRNLETALFSFWPHPRFFFNPKENLQLLNTIDEKTALMQNFGVQHLFLQPFDKEFRNLSGEDFIKTILVDRLNVKYLIIGHDHHFGKDRSGNYDLLKQLAPKYGFEIQQLGSIKLENQDVSSTKIRKALRNAKIKEANAMLGYHYNISGKVIHGKKLGRTIGFPTANIDYPADKLLPQKGAYIVETIVDGKSYKGMMSIGTNPTVNGTALTAEVYILNFDQDLYGKTISVNFREFLHEEIKFESIEMLIEKLKEDEKRTIQYDFSK